MLKYTIHVIIYMLILYVYQCNISNINGLLRYRIRYKKAISCYKRTSGRTLA